jgi:GDP-L-fucose synthase
MKEEYLMTGPLEPTNEGYAVAKLAGYKMCQFYAEQYGLKSISIMPCNLYGPKDSFDLEHCHVLTALVKRFSDAIKESKDEITLWGAGSAKRELMHVDDMAEAAVYLMENREDSEFINVGTGVDISIKDLAGMIAQKTGYKGKINWDTSKPDGMPRKCLDITRLLKAGFKPSITLEQGVEEVIKAYQVELG